MLHDTITNQLKTLEGNIQYMDAEEVENVLKSLSKEDVELIQHWIGQLNNLLIDGKVQI